jgi:hypothetical protein
MYIYIYMYVDPVEKKALREVKRQNEYQFGYGGNKLAAERFVFPPPGREWFASAQINGTSWGFLEMQTVHVGGGGLFLMSEAPLHHTLPNYTLPYPGLPGCSALLMCLSPRTLWFIGGDALR